MNQLPEYFSEFSHELECQIIEDNKRWGDTWIKRGKEGQEDRFFDYVSQKLYEFEVENKPFPWLKVAGEAMIGYVREKYLNNENL